MSAIALTREVRALARLEGWATGRFILRGSPKRLAPQDDGTYRIISATRPIALRSISSRIACATSSSGSRCEMFGRTFPASAHSFSAFNRASPSAGSFRAASPARTPSTLAPLISTRLVRASPMPPVKPITSTRAPQGDAAQAVFEDFAADGIEHDIGAAAVGEAFYDVAERLAGVKHPMIGAPRLRHGELFLAGGGCDHGGAEHLADLDRGKTDAAAGAMHQKHLARAKLAAIDQRVIGGAVGGKKGRAFGIVEGRRQRRKLRSCHHGFIGIRAVPHFNDYFVADRNAGRAIDFGHIAGGFHPRRERQCRLELIFAGRHQDVGEIDPGGTNGDADLARFQRRGDKSF
jgi:hypothetical protein